MDPFLESKINEIVSERPSYGTRRVTAMIWRSGHSVNRKHVRRHVLAMGLVDSRKKSMRMKSPRAIVVSTPNRMWGDIFYEGVHPRRRMCLFHRLHRSVLEEDQGSPGIQDVEDRRDNLRTRQCRADRIPGVAHLRSVHKIGQRLSIDVEKV